MNTKQCNRCNISRPVSEFGKKSDNRDGLRGQCNPCRKIERAEYNAANRDRLREYGRNHYAENRETIAQRKARYYSENKDRINQQQAKYRAANPEVKREYMKKWTAANPNHSAEYYAANKEAIREYSRAWRDENKDYIRERAAEYRADRPEVQWESRYRFRTRRAGGEPVMKPFTKAELIARHGDACAHCGGPWEELDHYPVPIVRGGEHSLDNCVPSCTPCNRRSWGEGFRETA